MILQHQCSKTIQAIYKLFLRVYCDQREYSQTYKINGPKESKNKHWLVTVTAFQICLVVWRKTQKSILENKAESPKLHWKLSFWSTEIIHLL